MTMTTPGGNGPSLSDIARRLQRVEDKLDERIATVEMLRASEKLFEAKEIAHTAELFSAKERITKLELAHSKFSFMLLGAFLGLLIQFIVLILTITSKGG
jgi:hypothetical protein